MNPCPKPSSPKRAIARRVAVGAVAVGLTLAPVIAASPASAAAFGAGNVVVCRVGTGAASLTNAATAVFLDEYNPVTNALVQSIAMPVAASAGTNPLTASGTATSECLITRSADGQYLVVTGYSATLGTSAVASTASAATPRVIGRVSAAGTVDTSTALTDYSTGNNPRSATSVDGTSFWAAGGAGGPRYAALGATSSTQISTTLANLRQANIFDGQLYASDSSGTALRLSTIGSGLPTSAGQTMTNLPGFPTTTASPYAFFFADLSTGIAGVDTLYVADDAAGLQKWSLVAGSWVLNNTVGAAADAYRGLTAKVNGSSVSLYATRKGGSGASGGGELVSLVDTAGYNANNNGTPALTSTAAANTSFRGVALAPFESPAPVVPEVPVAIAASLSMLVIAGGFVAIRHRRNLSVA